MGQADNGTIIHVAAGTYDENLSITKSVTIVGAGAGSTIIEAPASLSAEGSIIDVSGSSVSANISKLTVEGPGPSTCGSIMSGVFVENDAYAYLHNMAVNDIRDNPLSGCQNGRAVLVGWGHGAVDGMTNTAGSAKVVDVSISDYQKAGVEISGAGSSATVDNNNIIGVGSTSAIAANGIEVTYGAQANIHGNTVSDNSYTGSDFATGILLYNAADPTRVSSNSVTDNQIGFWTNTPDPLKYLDTTGISGNGRDAVADTTGWVAPPTTTYTDSAISGTTNSDGSTIVMTQGHAHVWDYDAFNTVQGALNAVATNGRVYVANGTYNENLNIPRSGLKVYGQSEVGVVVNTNSGYGINIDHQDHTRIDNMTFNSTGSSGYALHAYGVNGLSLNDLTFDGSGSNHTGGVDANSSQNLSYNNVSASNFGKNGFSVTAKYESTDNYSRNITFNGITANNNAWNGIAFYTTNSSGTDGHNITGVHFDGTNTVTNNGTGGNPSQGGIFIEGDSDGNFACNYIAGSCTPGYTVTSPGGILLLGNTNFSGNNGNDIVNFQTAGVNALSATFNSKTGNDMTAAERNTEDGMIYDQLDRANLGLVQYYNLPILLSPANNSYLQHAGILDWTDVPGAIGYEYESSHSGTTNSDGSLTSPIYQNNSLTASQIDASATAEGTYYWQVRAKFSDGSYSPWTAPWKLTVDNTKPGTPTITAPTGGQYFDSQPITDSWTSVTDNLSGVNHYQIAYHYNDGHSFGGTTCPGLSMTGYTGFIGCRDVNGTSRNHTPALSEQGGVTIWVRAIDNAGNVGDWSSPVNYYYDTTVLTAPSLISPSNNDVVNGASLTNSWSSVSGAVKYEYQSYNHSNLTGLRWDHEYNTNSKTAHNVADGTVFYWRVRAIDQYGKTGPWSDLWEVTVDNTAPVVAITSPSNGATLSYANDGTVAIKGSVTDANPDHYYWKITGPNNYDISQVVYDSSSFTNQAIKNWNLSGLTSGTYTIDLEARDAAGNKDAGSVTTEQVTVDNTAPSTPTASPSGGNYTGSQTVTLSSSDNSGNTPSIYYTTDGSTPSDTNGTLYTGAITVSADETIKAIAYDNAGNSSSVMTETYGIAPVISGEASINPTTSSITLVWTTNQPATSRVIYDTVSHSGLGSSTVDGYQTYGYAFTTPETDDAPNEVTTHSVTISGLTSGTTYYFRTVSHGSPESVSPEITGVTQIASTNGTPTYQVSFASTNTGTGTTAGATGAAAAGGNVLGASTNTPSNSSNSDGHVLGVSTTKPNNKTDKTVASTNVSNRFLGLGWWWIPILVLIIAALIYYVYSRADTTDKKSPSGK